MPSATQSIPASLIYEQIDGRPIYYRGYREVLDGTKKIEDVMGSSTLQAFLSAEIVFLLRSCLGKEYYLFTNELGILFKKRDWRSADIAAIRRSRLPELTGKYLNIPPDLIIEIDTKAELTEVTGPGSYYQKKTQHLLDFGVPKVVWIFTDTKKIMVAETGKPWIIYNWSDSVLLWDSCEVVIAELF